MENTTLKEQVDGLQKDIVQISEHVKEIVSLKGITSEVKEIAEKLSDVQAELHEKKHQFAVGTTIEVDKKEFDTRMDELLIARAVCTKTDGSFDKVAYEKIVNLPIYADVIKANVTATFADGANVNATDSINPGNAAEFVAPGFSSTLREEIWLSLQVGALFSRINMPNPTYTLPFLPGRIIAQGTTEGQTVTKSLVKSDKIVFSAKKLMAIVEMTDEFEQDSIVPALNLLRKQLIDSFALAQESMCMNGDVTLNNTLLCAAANAWSAGDCRKLVKGIRADAYDAAAANNKVSMASVTADGLRALRVPMVKYGQNPSDLAYIMSMTNYLKCLNSTNFPNYQSLNTYGANAQILTGELGRVDNIPIIVTELLPDPTILAPGTDAPDAPGGLNATGLFEGAGLHTYGTVVLVNRNAYQWGDRADFSLKLWLNPLNGTTNLIGTNRLDFEKVCSKTAKTVAASYATVA